MNEHTYVECTEFELREQSILGGKNIKENREER